MGLDELDERRRRIEADPVAYLRSIGREVSMELGDISTEIDKKLRPHWEKALKRERAERATLRRVGFPYKSPLRKVWRWYDDVMWMPEPLDEAVFNVIAKTICLVHNHTPYTEMDNKTIVCAICRKKLGEHEA